jgi:hypothetical protein
MCYMFLMLQKIFFPSINSPQMMMFT